MKSFNHRNGPQVEIYGLTYLSSDTKKTSETDSTTQTTKSARQNNPPFAEGFRRFPFWADELDTTSPGALKDSSNIKLLFIPHYRQILSACQSHDALNGPRTQLAANKLVVIGEFRRDECVDPPGPCLLYSCHFVARYANFSTDTGQLLRS